MSKPLLFRAKQGPPEELLSWWALCIQDSWQTTWGPLPPQRPLKDPWHQEITNTATIHWELIPWNCWTPPVSTDGSPLGHHSQDDWDPGKQLPGLPSRESLVRQFQHLLSTWCVQLQWLLLRLCFRDWQRIRCSDSWRCLREKSDNGTKIRPHLVCYFMNHLWWKGPKYIHSRLSWKILDMEMLLGDRKESEEVKSLVCLTYFHVPAPTQSQHSENTYAMFDLINKSFLSWLGSSFILSGPSKDTGGSSRWQLRMAWEHFCHSLS